MKRNHGFTLIELLTTILLAVILISVAVPSFRTMILNNRITTAGNSLARSLNMARADAIREGRTVRVCVPTAPSCNGTDWASGWQLWGDRNNNANVDSGEILGAENAMPQSITITSAGFANGGYIEYLASGVSGSSGTFTVCDSSRSGESGVQVSVSTTGQITSATVTCS